MSLPSILTFVGPSTGGATFKLSQRASQVLGAPTTLLVVKQDGRNMIPIAGMGEVMSAAIVEDALQRAEAEAKAALNAASAAAKNWPSDLKVAVVEDEGRPYDVVAQFGRVHGLTIIQRAGVEPSEDDALDAVLYRTGRPALIAPANSPETLGERIAVFWNDSPEAAKAFWAAYPFLRAAKEVQIFSCDEGFDAKGSLDRFQMHLKALAINAKTTVVGAPSSGSAGEALQDAAAEMNADLVVMGAYTHSRLSEMILGGVTKTVLDELDRPVLLAH